LTQWIIGEKGAISPRKRLFLNQSMIISFLSLTLSNIFKKLIQRPSSNSMVNCKFIDSGHWNY